MHLELSGLIGCCHSGFRATGVPAGCGAVFRHARGTGAGWPEGDGGGPRHFAAELAELARAAGWYVHPEAPFGATRQPVYLCPRHAGGLPPPPRLGGGAGGDHVN
jgi:hypothetical protein